ncbi:shikimate kinase [Flavobacterium saliperosum S13]|uniref:Shikimate kinase n=2 Tax=Flavobacterium saliperosum TaxID=329186 RepID=A0A1G4V1K5_9FLAO|nr:shikimate kinase [Flavobacterium saliperosum]ESU28566.1 shikimate kinase [Flavobacterium saliperosum S13]SCW99776.1 shikimate kinase [Flavobacterium saliperosum]
MKKIVLLGYMGSGKTTVGKIMSEKTGIPFFDLDEIIEKNMQKTISELFLELGEIRFRKLEHETLNHFLATQIDFILSLGGGTPCYANNHLQLQKEGITSVYLKASLPELIKRLSAEKAHRPLLASKEGDEFQEFIAKHLFERSYFYNQAKHVVSVDAKTPDEIVQEINTLLT